MKDIFINGVDSYLETYFEIVSYMQTDLANTSFSKLDEYISSGNIGFPILYDLAKDWTTEFEKLYEEEEWYDKEWLDTLWEFVLDKINKL